MTARAPHGGGSTETLLAFLTTTCAHCQAFWEMIAGTPLTADLGVHLVVVTPSRSMEDERRARQLTPAGAYLHMGSETWFAYGVGRAGTFVLVRTLDGDPPPWQEPGTVLGSAAPEDPSELMDLVKRWQGRAEDGRTG